MGDGGYIQTSSRRGSFRKETSFKEWEQNTETQSSTSTNYVSQMSYSSGTVPALAGYGRTREGSPEAAFGWGGDGVGGDGMFGSSRSTVYHHEEQGYESSLGMSRMGRMGYVGTVESFGIDSNSNYQGLQQNVGASHESYGLRGPGGFDPPQICGRDNMSEVGGGPGGGGDRRDHDYTVTSPKSVKSSGNIPVSLDDMMLSGESSMLTIENLENADSKELWLTDTNQDLDECMNHSQSLPMTGPRPGWGSSPNGSPRSQLSPVIEDVDCRTPDHVLSESRTPTVTEVEEDYTPTQQESILISPTSRENAYELSQFPLGPNVSSYSEPGPPQPSRWNGRSIDSTPVAEPPRVVREQYINKLRGAGEHLIRAGKFCVKNVWFWVAVVGVLAGVEGFNEEKRNNSNLADEILWSDDED